MQVVNEPSMLGSCLQGCVPQHGELVLSSRFLPALSMHMPANQCKPGRRHAGTHLQLDGVILIKGQPGPCTGSPCLSTRVSKAAVQVLVSTDQLACSLTLWPCTKGSSSTGLPPCTARLTADFSPWLQAREREGGEVRSGRGLRGARSWVLSPGGASHPGWATALAAQQLGGWWGGNKEGWRAQQDVCGRWAAKNRPQPGWKRVAGAPPRPRRRPQTTCHSIQLSHPINNATLYTLSRELSALVLLLGLGVRLVAALPLHLSLHLREARALIGTQVGRR